jgi:hypothetical protein
MIVSIHVPKTGGSTFGNYLKKQFQDEMLYVYPCLKCNRWICDRDLDNCHKRRKTEPCQDHAGSNRDVARYLQESGTRCIHGHFTTQTFGLDFKKYAHVAWVRDPVDRALSHWEFWQRNHDGRGQEGDLLIQSGNIEAFFRYSANLQTKCLKNMPLKHFRFVGITEQFDEGLRQFNDLFGLPCVEAKNVNINPAKGIGGYQIDQQKRTLIGSFNQEDMRLYADAVRLFEINKEKNLLIKTAKRKLFLFQRDLRKVFKRG